MMHHNIHTAGVFLRLILLKQSPFKTHFPIGNFLCFVCHGNCSLRALIWKKTKGKFFMPSNVRTCLCSTLFSSAFLTLHVIENIYTLIALFLLQWTTYLSFFWFFLFIVFTGSHTAGAAWAVLAEYPCYSVDSFPEFFF